MLAVNQTALGRWIMWDGNLVQGGLACHTVGMGETRVDLAHLLEDLRDAYPGALEDTILTEIVANSLDSAAGSIVLAARPDERLLTVLDDGRGMTRRELSRYHDLATSSKSRGRGIGFAGVGIKLGLLLADEVVTETRRGNVHVATSWRLSSRTRAPWKWVEPGGLVTAQGTAVSLRLINPLSPLLDSGFLAATITRHFQPLLDPAFDELLSSAYPGGIMFVVGRRILKRGAVELSASAPLQVRVGRRRKPVGVGYLARAAEALPEGERGLAISTLGKVIMRGWDWLGITPAEAERLHGLIEVPALAESLTLNKADFIRTGARGATFLAYRKAIQEAVSAPLAAWGNEPEPEPARRPRTRPLERDLENVLVDLAREYPLITSLVDRRSGGQQRLRFADPADPSLGEAASPLNELQGSTPSGEDDSASAAHDDSDKRDPAPASPTTGSGLPSRRGRSKPVRLGIEIRFENRPEDTQLARLIESTVWINDAHPAYQRAAAARAEGYHIALAVALAMAPLAVDAAAVHDFVTAFMTRWGSATNGKPRRR